MIDYKINEPISVKQFIGLLNKTTLGARRPLEDEKRVAAMLHHADLLITAWDGERLQYQKQGIGLQLIEHTKQALHPQAKIVLLSAPQAVDYYPHIGFTQHMSAWTKS